MKRVTGIGGVFFKAKDQAAMNEWYIKHLGINITQWGATFDWADEPNGTTAFTIFKQESKYYEGPFMINFRVANLVELFAKLKEEGVQVVEGIDDGDFGKFAWIYDPEGNKIELWEPKE